MKKIVILSLIAPAVLGLAACGGQSGSGNVASGDVVTNADDVNLSDDFNAIDANATAPVDTVPATATTNAN